MMLVRIQRVAFPRVASISTRTRVCVYRISPHRFVERDEVAATRASNCPDPNANHHPVVIASTRSMRAFVHSSSRVNNVFARRPRVRDRSTNGCFLFLCIFFPSTSRRTHRDGLASATRARRDDASMNRIVAIARRPSHRRPLLRLSPVAHSPRPTPHSPMPSLHPCGSLHFFISIFKPTRGQREMRLWEETRRRGGGGGCQSATTRRGGTRR